MHFDFLIVGGGMVGLALARALLDQSLQAKPLTIALIEAESFESLSKPDLRVSALNAGAIELLSQWGLWTDEHFPDRSIYRHMEVWDSQSSGKLLFHASEMGQGSLGYIVKNQRVVKALWEDLARHSRVTFFSPLEWTSLERINESYWEMGLSNGEVISGDCLVGADGAASRVREFFKLPCDRTDYGQKAIVANIGSEHAHGHTAYQRFLPEGPLAFLPLLEKHQGSIVWTLSASEADRIMRLSEADFNQELTQALDGRLGGLALESARACFPLKHHHAKSYVVPKGFLIGDAAHGIHPLAGLGVNLGFHDVRVLLDILKEGAGEGRPLVTGANFKKYERQAWAYNEKVHQSMTVINALFRGQKSSELCVKTRGLGMNLMNRFDIVKNLFSRVAQG